MQLPHQHSKLLKRCTHEAVFLASSMFDRSAEAARLTLEEAEQQSTAPASRQQLADAMVALARHRGKLRTRFPARLEVAINQALMAASEADLTPVRHSNLASLESVTIMADADVSQFVETSRLQQTVLPVVDERLTRLDTLMSSALGLPVVRADLNPMRPEVLCNALMEVLDELDDSAEVRHLLLRHLTRPFADEINRLYATVIKLLEEKGVQEARYRLRLTAGGTRFAGGGGGAARPAAAGAGNEGLTNLAAGAPASGRGAGFQMPPAADLARAESNLSYDVVHDFLYRPQWAGENDAPLPPGFYQAVQKEMQTCAAVAASTQLPSDAEIYAAQQERRALPVMERPPQELDAQAVLSRETWGEVASPQARTQTLIHLKSQARKVSQVIGLDAVRALIDQVAGDVRVLPPVREAFVALEPALLRMALRDPRFMGDEQHPARRMVEAIAQRSFKYNDEFSSEFNAFIEPVRAAVRALDEQKTAAAQDFERHLKELQERWSDEDLEDNVNQEHGLKSIHFAHDRQALADKVAWGFSLRPDIEGVPRIVLDFLYNTWSLVIAHAQLTDTRGQIDPGGYLAVVTELLWSVNQEATLRQPARLFEIVPHIVQTLRSGLDMLDYSPRESKRFFNALMGYHNPVLRLRRARSALDAEASGLPALSTLDLPEEQPPHPADQGSADFETLKSDTSEQPWLAQSERTAAGFEAVEADDTSGMGDIPTLTDTLPPGAHFSETQINALPSFDAPTTIMAAHPDEQASDDERARCQAELARLREDVWVNLYSHGKWLRARLTWINGNGTLFMFSSQGGQPHTMTRRICERLIRRNHLRVVDSGEVVDKAMQSLREKDRRKKRQPAPAA